MYGCAVGPFGLVGARVFRTSGGVELLRLVVGWWWEMVGQEYGRRRWWWLNGLMG
jgi:hypothetical protein